VVRPTKKRRIENLPNIELFKPAGVPNSQLEEFNLTYEELESLRLKDIEGLDNISCADRMHISRTTFQRILGSARNKIARALIEGSSIRIEGGNYKLAKRRFRCGSCDYEMERPFDGVRAKDLSCPKCSKKELKRIE
jgi:predicted DNA-binding protein (UPF0251 family)